ncbi:hypothetical protein HG536_0C01480 [Torulaspora globosa]|uniref:Uncharacterized protein n=1 Tax=Torulaspora globosa TaxID=48254 RepID=A0A7G3ZEP4_9SACH|nr:uncharacterized protein HG536_0C01480 [Torulaspora globosa]QLL31980.1 hypothetical protein HG536_0C01480 [Torulaspora globosa]
MEKFEALVQTCVDFVLPSFKQLARRADNILDEPLEESSFAAEVVQLKWPAIQSGEIAETNLDAFILLVATRGISDTLTLESDHDEATLRNGILVAAVVLDFCFHSRKYRQNPSTWSNSYFGLFSSVVDSLSWPRGLLEFWPYAESRIEWFKMCNSIDVVPVGTSNLVSYKQPLYDKLRYWNELLTTVQNNSYLNTPLHYEMKFKLEKFLSELLPISEESNFNRSAMFSTKLSSGNPWNKTINSSTRSDSSSENVFATDFNYVYSNLISNPLEFIYKPLEFKIDLDKTLSALLDAIFEVEEDFHKKIDISRKTVSSINEKLNYDFPPDFELSESRVPNYIAISEKFNRERQTYWTGFVGLKVSLSSLLQPTPFDMSMSHPPMLYDQIMEPENDYFRKQFILQICFTMNLIRQIVTSSDVENYYKSCYQKERPSRSIKFDSLNEANHKKTISLCDHILNNYISKFYHQRDPLFASIIEKVLKADEEFLKSKMDGFKSFHSFVIPQEAIEGRSIDYSFKKFGFVPLGNKSINNVWKIKTGLDQIETCPNNAKDFFEDLRSNLTSSEEQARPRDIIKDWQTLRRLRSQYLFDFNKVNEEIGINGLFSMSPIVANNLKKRKAIDIMLERLKEPHLRKLEAARKFSSERLKRKREQEAEHEHATLKQRKLDESEIGPTDLTQEEMENSQNSGQQTPELPIKHQKDQAQWNDEQLPKDSNEQTDLAKEGSELANLSDRPQSAIESPKLQST